MGEGGATSPVAELFELTITSEEPTPIVLPEWVISTIEKGETTVRHRRELLEFGPGALGITSPFVLGKVERQRTPSTEARLVLLGDRIVQDAREAMLHTGSPRDLLMLSEDPRLRTSLDRLIRAVERDARPLELETAASTCARHIVRSSEPKELAGRALRAAQPRVERARELIHDSFGEDFSLAKLADVAGLSITHFVRAFGAELGYSPLVYTMAVRLGHARTRIVAGDGLADVARECGFYDQSHLHRWLRRAIGVTPTQLRSGHPWHM